jgi:DNA-binding NtrC family response regulator
MMHQERFRTDLYYRIAVIPMVIPPLRERTEDILLLAAHFLKKYRKKTKGGSKNVSHKAQGALISYSWPGNIRELENSIEYALAMSKSDTIRSTDFPFQILPGNKKCLSIEKPEVEKTADLVQNENNPKKHEAKDKTSFVRLSRPTFEEEKEAILSALKHYFGNRELTARSLGISKVTLWKKMKRHGLVGWKYDHEDA